MLDFSEYKKYADRRIKTTIVTDKQNELLFMDEVDGFDPYRSLFSDKKEAILLSVLSASLAFQEPNRSIWQLNCLLYYYSDKFKKSYEDTINSMPVNLLNIFADMLNQQNKTFKSVYDELASPARARALAKMNFGSEIFAINGECINGIYEETGNLDLKKYGEDRFFGAEIIPGTSVCFTEANSDKMSLSFESIGVPYMWLSWAIRTVSTWAVNNDIENQYMNYTCIDMKTKETLLTGYSKCNESNMN